MMSRVARWISGQSVATPSSTTVIRYSRWSAAITVANTQISVIVPGTTSDLTRRRDFHRLAGVEKAALHIHDNQRRPTPLWRQHALEDLAAVGHLSVLSSNSC